jgi:hypothetical protein
LHEEAQAGGHAGRGAAAAEQQQQQSSSSSSSSKQDFFSDGIRDGGGGGGGGGSLEVPAQVRACVHEPIEGFLRGGWNFKAWMRNLSSTTTTSQPITKSHSSRARRRRRPSRPGLTMSDMAPEQARTRGLLQLSSHQQTLRRRPRR